MKKFAKKYTGSSTITIKEDEGDVQPVEEQKNTMKIEGGGKEQKQKKKGFC